MGNKDYVRLVEGYQKALGAAAPAVIPVADKKKLADFLDDIAKTLKMYGESDPYITKHNAIYTDFDKLNDKTKKYNAEVKTRNSYLDAAGKYAKSGQTLAGQQKGFANVKELKKLSDDMENVASWLDIAKRKELSVSLTEP